MPRTPTLAELLNAFGAKLVAGVRVCLPGRVESYDATTGRADVKPLLKEQAYGEDGLPFSESLPVIPSVPIVFPGAGGFCVTFPVAPGDLVLLVFADRSTDAFLVQGTEVDPADPRRHDLTDAFAIPGLQVKPWANAAAATDHATIGKDGGLRVHLKPAAVEIGEAPGDAAALASKTEARLAALEAFAPGHVHISAAPGSPTGPGVGPPVGGDPVASTTLKLPS